MLRYKTDIEVKKKKKRTEKSKKKESKNEIWKKKIDRKPKT